MTQQPKIISQQVIVVDFAETDDYGNLQVTDKGGGTTKVSKKREHLHELFQEGQAVELFFAKYMDVVYVAGAKLVETPPPTAPVTPPPQIDEPTEEELADFPPQPAKNLQVDARQHDIHRQVALKSATLCMPYLKNLKHLLPCSEWLLKYLNGELSEQDIHKGFYDEEK